MLLLNCKDVEFGYEGKAVLSQVNFQVNSGDYLCVIGENGAGKSTLIKGLLKLISPMKGEVLYSVELKDNEIGYLPQQTMIQRNFPASVYEVVLSGRINQMKGRAFYSKADRQDAKEKLEMMGIAHLQKTCYQDLSGGQQQRVLLARALCATKKLLLLDEPVAGLDPLATQDLYELVKRINSRLGITVIMVSHDMRASVEYASHILHLSNSQLYFGGKEDYLSSDAGKRFLQVGVLEGEAYATSNH